ncbi:hypothetical protein THOM_3099 [Trachipleistophora hominis]|uniref:Uncharacterized protein n=1 Tax=Trachipleistophora hominis TaxID=72359 RepID=L7JSH8_TRAHO|nr:hypothetical protein THOM_3099 [Trachipleistophora hominis]
MKNKIEIVKSTARVNRIKRTMIRFKCINERKYTLITAQIMGYVTTPYAQKCFMQSVPVPLLVNEVFVSRTVHFNAFLPSNLPPSIGALQSSVKYFIVVKVFDGKDELACIKGKFRLLSDTSTYDFREIYMLNQNCCRVGSRTYEEHVLTLIRNKLQGCDQVRCLTAVLDAQASKESQNTGQAETNDRKSAADTGTVPTHKTGEDRNVQDAMQDLRIEENRTEAEILEYKLAKINEMGLLNDIKSAQLKYKRESKPNLHILLDNEHSEEQKLIKLVIKDKKVKLAEIKMKNFFYTNDENVFNIRLLKEMKKIKAVVKMKEEAEYTSKETVLFIFERHNLEYLLHMNVFLTRFTRCTFNSDLFKVNFL